MFIIRMPDDEAEIHEASDQKADNNAGPFEILQARQLLESNIAEFAAQQATREDIIKMRRALQIQEEELEFDSHETGDMEFHLAIAEATHNSMLVDLFKQSWQWRVDNPMWNQLHTHLKDTRYRSEWLIDHKLILAALVKKEQPKPLCGSISKMLRTASLSFQIPMTLILMVIYFHHGHL